MNNLLISLQSTQRYIIFQFKGVQMRLDNWPNRMKKWVSLNACVYIFEQHFCLKRRKKTTTNFECHCISVWSIHLLEYIYWNTFHNENMSVQYEAISKSGKNDIFRCKNEFFFLIFALKHRLWVLVRTASMF